MLQNRIDPFGNIFRTEARGAWTGTRGILHNERKEIIRPFKGKAWLTCKLEFRGRTRTVMSPDRYTELFFLDEATAFAAGHRPCCECRRDDFDKFKASWITGNPGYNFDRKISIQKIDSILHEERIKGDRSKQAYEERLHDIPDGSFVSLDGRAFLIVNKELFLWSPFGYSKGISPPKTQYFTILTPASVLNAFRAGYRPQIAKF